MSLIRKLSQSPRATRRSSSARRARFEVESLESRVVLYSASGNLWPSAQLVTLSFMPDGASIGGRPSNLMATFNAKFGSAAAWQNVVLRAAQVWAQQTNINFAVVPDNGAGVGTGSYQQGDPGFGDIRIGGYNFGDSTLAGAYMPPAVNNFSAAGDFQFNTSQTFNMNSAFHLFTVAAHEIGHTLGLHHSSVGSAQMYANYNGIKSALATDDINGIRSIYGGARAADGYDAIASNGTTATATDITSLIDTTALTALVSDLDITTTTDQDFYKFQAPVGLSGTTTIGVVSQGLSLLSPKVTISNAAGTSLGTISSSNYGATLSLIVSGLTAGDTYYVKVNGVDSTAFGTGAYALTLNFGTGSSPTVPLPNTQLLNGSPIRGGGGEAIKVAQETLVNTYTAGAQETNGVSPGSVAMDGNGNYVVTWASKGQDGDGWGVYAQRFDASGDKRGGEFRVNSTTQDNQADASVAMNEGGEFVVTWASKGQDGDGWGVYAQRFDASGARRGGEFRVNSATDKDQADASVAMNEGGEFVVTWASKGQDGDGWGVYAQRFDASGDKRGGEFRVNSATRDDQANPSVAMGASGNFVIIWSSKGQDERKSWGVYAQRFDASGEEQGGEFRVNSTTDGDQKDSSVAMDDAGNFFVSWSSNQRGTTGWGIFGRQYRADGRSQGEEIQIETSSSQDQVHSTVAVDSYGHAVVVWSGNGTADKSGVFMQRFDLTRTDLADGISDFLESEGHDHDHDAQRQQSKSHFAEPDLDLISDVASAVESRGARGNRVRLLDRPGFPWWGARRRLVGHR